MIKKRKTLFVRKPEGNKPPRRPVRRWEDKIKGNLKEGVDCICLTQDRDRGRLFKDVKEFSLNEKVANFTS